MISAADMAGRIEQGLALIEAEFAQDPPNLYHRRHRAAEQLARELADAHGARYGDGGTIAAHRFRFAGIACSCTGGTIGLLRAWAIKARKAAP